MTDVARIAMAMQRAGIDPRDWIKLAVVRKVNVDASGVICDIKTLDGIVETAALAPSYGGRNYGFHTPPEEGALVVVAIPEGDFGAGARVIAQVWDKGEPPPQDAIDHPEDVVLVVRPDRSIRIIVTGDGDAVVAARGGGKVKLGDDDASDPAAMESTLLDFNAALAAAIATLASNSDPSVNALSQLQSQLGSIPPAIPPDLRVHVGKKFPVCAEKVDVK